MVADICLVHVVKHVPCMNTLDPSYGIVLSFMAIGLA